tara:strand:+ start:3741 stop:4838 length:1098 start_codon:yes stop_codon:yes gene_type:complete
MIIILYVSLCSFIYNNSNFPNLLLFVFGIVKTFIIIISAYMSNISLKLFLEKYINMISIIFKICLFFIFIDCFSYILGGNISFDDDWTGNFLISAHDFCAVSLMLFAYYNYKSLFLNNKIGQVSLFYLFFAIIAGNWSLILLFLPFYFVVLLRSKLIKIYSVKILSLVSIFILFSYQFIYKSYSGIFQNANKFIQLIPQVDYWNNLSFNKLINYNFLLLGIGPGMGGSPAAEKYKTEFYLEYFYPYVLLFKERTNISGIFTQPFSSFNTIVSDSGLVVFFCITSLFFIILFKSYRSINYNDILDFKIVYSFIFVIFSISIFRSFLISSYNAGGEALLYVGCIFIGLIINNSSVGISSYDKQITRT